MADTDSIITNASEGLPRRKAIQGLAGSLAGIAALGAVSASAKKKKKKKKPKSTAGTLVKHQTASQTASVPTFTALAPTTTVTANCPAAGTDEQVFATGGGFKGVASILASSDMIAITSQATSNGTGWEVAFKNQTPAAANATVTVVCAYFKTK